MDLDLLHVDRLGADAHSHLVAVTGTVVAIGRGLQCELCVCLPP